jgi:hypothetical protein
MSILPCSAAPFNAVLPLISAGGALTSAPFSRRRKAIPRKPFIAAN